MYRHAHEMNKFFLSSFCVFFSLFYFILFLFFFLEKHDGHATIQVWRQTSPTRRGLPISWPTSNWLPSFSLTLNRYFVHPLTSLPFFSLCTRFSLSSSLEQHRSMHQTFWLSSISLTSCCRDAIDVQHTCMGSAWLQIRLMVWGMTCRGQCID